jgi:hypothetical protein
VLPGHGDGTFQDPVTYTVGSGPDALMAGDFDGNGRTDLAVANAGSYDVSVLLGNGDGTFQDPVTYFVGSGPDALVSGDFNGDGGTDLAVANAGSYNVVAVLLGNGDGTFQDPVAYTVGTGPGALVSGDFDGNGGTDLAVANADSSSLSILLGNGDGTFQDQVWYAVGNAPDALVSGDFNGDGRLDLASANAASGDVSVLLGNGDGTFQDPVAYTVGSDPGAIVSGDFNGDGRIDLAVANLGSLDSEGNLVPGTNVVAVLLGNGDGTFQDPVTCAVGSYPDSLVSGDFNGDGRTDLAVANGFSKDVSVLLGHGDGTFQEQVTYAVGSYPDSLAAGDFNGDGRTDLAVANYGSYPNPGTVSVLLSHSDGTFQDQVTYAVGSEPRALVAGDFDGNGRTDLAVVNGGSGDMSVLLGKGDGTFQKAVTRAAVSVPVALVSGDFDGDGRTDLAVANNLSLTVSVLLGNGDGTFQKQVNYVLGSGPVALVSGDFNGDGRTDLASANEDSNALSLLLGKGDGTFQNQVIHAVGSGPNALVSGDFNGDGRTDLASANENSNEVSVLLGHGDGTFQNRVTYQVGSNPVALVSGDFNGDGRTDLAVAKLGSDAVSVLLGNGDGTFQNPVRYTVGGGPRALASGDFNGDGRTDLAVANVGFPSTVSVLLGHGDGTFQDPVPYAAGSYTVALVSGDFNGDGRLDLASANFYSNDVSVLLGRGDGTFRDQVTYAVGSGPLALVSGDFDGDSRTDLAVANAGSNTVSVLLSHGGGTFQDPVTYPVGSYPRALVSGDFDGDGRTDLAVANEGSGDVSVLLGRVHGTFQDPVTYAVGSYPLALVSGDFNGDGRTDFAGANVGFPDVSVLLNLNGTFTAPGPQVTTPQASPVTADLTGDDTLDAFVINGAGDVLWRRRRPDEPGSYDPPIAINPGHPSRDILAVDTNQGPVLASVDATDAVISLYAWRDHGFARIGSLPTGLLPAQIVMADLDGDGSNDLVVRNTGDGTLSIYFNNRSQSGPTSGPRIPFRTPVTLSLGPGISDVTLADVSGHGRKDILVTYKLTGEVGVVRNLGNGTFDPGVAYRAGNGLYAVTSSRDTAPLVLTTLEATAGVAAGALTTGRPADLVAINPGSNTFSVLSGLGAGRFANPVRFLTTSPARAIRIADLEGNGVPDAIVLSARGVTIDRSDGTGGFLPNPRTFDAGPDPTGETVTDVNHDGKPDLLIGDAYGDLLVLLGNGDGTFQPGHSADQNVALAVLPNGSPTPDFIYADQELDRVVVDYGKGPTKPVADRSSGLLAPGAVALADLNGDGIPDLIVANSGSNNVLVYPGLGNGQFGAELNGGHGFFTGTNPVGITAVDLHDDGSNDHHLDLVIANKGSNDVSILFYQPAAQGGFTFTPGPRLQSGFGPTSTVVQDVNGDGHPDLLVSDSGSNDVRLLPGVGNGFFNDQNPSTFPVGTTPMQVIVAPVLPNQPGPEIVTVNRSSNDITVISNFNSTAPVFDTFSTGGVEPLEAIALEFPGQALDSLLVANSDGVFTLLVGADGLVVEAPQSYPELPEPTDLVLREISGDEVSFYATTAGTEAAFTLSFVLPGFALTPSPSHEHAEPGSGPDPESPVSGPAPEPPLQLLAISETALALVGTLLVTVLNTPTSATPAAAPALENQDEVSTSFLSLAPSQGQGLFTRLNTEESGGDEAGEEEAAPETPVAQGASAPPWVRSALGLDELFQEIRQENQDAFFDFDFEFDEEGETPADTDKATGNGPGDPSSPVCPDVATPRANEPATMPGPDASLPGRSPQVDRDRADTRAIDEALGSLWAVQPTNPPPACPVAPEPAGPRPLPRMSAWDASGAHAPGTQSTELVPVWVPLLLSTALVIHASPLAETLRDRRRRACPPHRASRVFRNVFRP